MEAKSKERESTPCTAPKETVSPAGRKNDGPLLNRMDSALFCADIRLLKGASPLLQIMSVVTDVRTSTEEALWL